MRFLLPLLLVACAAAQNVTISVWNGVLDQKALFYGYLSVEGGLPLVRGSSLWIPVDKGMFLWTMPAANVLDKWVTVSGDFNVDPNLDYDFRHDPSKLFVPHWKTSIHCSKSFQSTVKVFGVLFLESAPGKYSCEIQR